MLDFCGEKGIAADVEVIPIDQINEAYERMLKTTCAIASSSTRQLQINLPKASAWQGGESPPVDRTGRGMKFSARPE
jgi:hypothetical protein